MSAKLYRFVVTAVDGRHYHDPKSWEEAHKDAAQWHGRDVQDLLGSYADPYGRELWEHPYGGMTAVEEYTE